MKICRARHPGRQLPEPAGMMHRAGSTPGFRDGGHERQALVARQPHQVMDPAETVRTRISRRPGLEAEGVCFRANAPQARAAEAASVAEGDDVRLRSNHGIAAENRSCSLIERRFLHRHAAPAHVMDRGSVMCFRDYPTTRVGWCLMWLSDRPAVRCRQAHRRIVARPPPAVAGTNQTPASPPRKSRPR